MGSGLKVVDKEISPPKVLAAAASGVSAKITENGGDVERIFARASIKQTDIDSPVNELQLHNFCALFEEAASETGNDNFGLRFGDDFEPKRLGPIGYAAISSPTLSAALRNMETYFPAHQTKTSFGILQDSDILWLSYKIIDPRVTRRRQDAELSVGMFINVFRHCLGQDWAPLEVRFEHQTPEDPSEHERRYKAPVRFGRRTNAIAFRRRDLDARMPTQDPYLYSIIEPFLQSRCELLSNPEDFATVVRNEIMLNLDETPPSLSDLAKKLGMTSQSFQRRLRENDLSFQDLLKAARQELALHYLKDPDVSLTEVAMLLGYSELSAFSRAFRAWTGMSPHRYRRLGYV